MHEASIANSILEICLTSTPENARVDQIEVSLGKLSCIEKISLATYFNYLVQGTRCEGAKLILTTLNDTCHCNKCDRNYAYGLRYTACPQCGSSLVFTSTAFEAYVTGLTYEDNKD